jgi:hypothetical protein
MNNLPEASFEASFFLDPQAAFIDHFPQQSRVVEYATDQIDIFYLRFTGLSHGSTHKEAHGIPHGPIGDIPGIDRPGRALVEIHFRHREFKVELFPPDIERNLDRQARGDLKGTVGLVKLGWQAEMTDSDLYRYRHARFLFLKGLGFIPNIHL